MNGVKRDAYRMRCKGSSMLQQPRPEDSTAGQCIICGRFMEELKDNRCRTEECEEALKKLCLTKGQGRTLNLGNGDFITVIRTAGVVTEREHWYSEAAEVFGQVVETDNCACGRALKMPRRALCAQCYREQNVAKLHNRQKRRQANKVVNKIKGLDKIKL